MKPKGWTFTLLVAPQHLANQFKGRNAAAGAGNARDDHGDGECRAQFARARGIKERLAAKKPS
jgi:hypothetical protein